MIGKQIELTRFQPRVQLSGENYLHPLPLSQGEGKGGGILRVLFTNVSDAPFLAFPLREGEGIR